MTKLRCSVSGCAYHQEGLCCRHNIKIEGTTADVSDSTACASFVDRRKTGFMNEYESEPMPELGIECMAEKCAYNRGLHCTASNVHVSGSNISNNAGRATSFDETRCDTFVYD